MRPGGRGGARVDVGRGGRWGWSRGASARKVGKGEVAGGEAASLDGGRRDGSGRSLLRGRGFEIRHGVVGDGREA